MSEEITNIEIFDKIESIMKIGTIDEIEDLVEEYEEICEESDLEYPSYEEEVFAIAVRVGNYDYVAQHADDFDLNFSDNSRSEPTCPYLYETNDEDIVQLLYDCGAFVDWEEYEFGYPFATDTSNWFIIAFEAEFQEMVFNRMLDYLGFDRDEFFETLDDHDQANMITIAGYSLSSIMKWFRWKHSNGEINFQDFGYIESEDGLWIKEIIEVLGYELKYVGSNNRYERIGVYYLEYSSLNEE